MTQALRDRAIADFAAPIYQIETGRKQPSWEPADAILAVLEHELVVVPRRQKRRARRASRK